MTCTSIKFGNWHRFLNQRLRLAFIIFKTQLVPRSKQYSPRLYKPRNLMQYMEIISFCSEKHTDNIHGMYEKERGIFRHFSKIAKDNY